MQEWSVKLRGSHSDYQEIKLRRELPDDPNYTVVIVDIEKFMRMNQNEQECYIIPPPPSWEPGREEGLKEFLNSSSGVPNMPQVDFYLNTVKKYFGLFGEKTVGVASFINGRHRTAYMHYHGAKYLPVEVHVDSANLLKEYCGV